MPKRTVFLLCVLCSLVSFIGGCVFVAKSIQADHADAAAYSHTTDR